MVMEPEKSHSLLSANWRTRKADDIIQFVFEGLRTRSCDVQEQEKMNILAQEEGERICPSSAFCPVKKGLSTSLNPVKWTHKVNQHTRIINQYSQTFSCITEFGAPNNSGQVH